MRMFIAVSVPEHIKEHAKAVKERLCADQSDVKWVEYKNYHLTLKFLGEVSSSQLKEIKTAAIGCRAGGCSLSAECRYHRILP